MKPIETLYKDRRFRSRLEARWAVFFDHLQVRWEYEKEGYALRSGWYLPDFWLPDMSVWIEIKGVAPTHRELSLIRELGTATGHRSILFWGDVPGYDPRDSSSDHRVAEDNYNFCICAECGEVGIHYEGRSDRMACKECYGCFQARFGRPINGLLCECRPSRTKWPCKRSDHGDQWMTADHPRVLAAVAAAHSARFEFGEDPRPIFNGTK